MLSCNKCPEAVDLYKPDSQIPDTQLGFVPQWSKINWIWGDGIPGFGGESGDKIHQNSN